jgi:hypothetical protein
MVTAHLLRIAPTRENYNHLVELFALAEAIWEVVLLGLSV